MEKRCLLAGLALLAIPACGPGPCRRERVRTIRVEEPACVSINVKPSCDTQLCIPSKQVDELIVAQPMSEDVEGFAFEEPGNTFKLLDEEGEDIVAPVSAQDENDAWFDERIEQAQKHGFKTVYFKYGSYALQPEQQAALEHDLKKVGEALKKGCTIIIEGHACCFAGKPDYNMHLSEERARAVARYFVEQGLTQEKLKVVGRGSEMCIVPEGDREQRAPNRRVEFYVLESGSTEAKPL